MTVSRTMAVLATILGSGCSSGTQEMGAMQVDMDLTMGTNAERIADAAPAVVFLGSQLQVTTKSNSAGNRLVIAVDRDSVQQATSYSIGVGTPVQAGFTVPGSSGTVFFETGSVVFTSINWTAAGKLTGTFSGLHRPADSLGLAPEASADGSMNITIPAN
jgi:hypothetical protein